jgi:hypothetical protein
LHDCLNSQSQLECESTEPATITPEPAETLRRRCGHSQAMASSAALPCQDAYTGYVGGIPRWHARRLSDAGVEHGLCTARGHGQNVDVPIAAGLPCNTASTCLMTSIETRDGFQRDAALMRCGTESIRAGLSIYRVPTYRSWYTVSIPSVPQHAISDDDTTKRMMP